MSSREWWGIPISLGLLPSTAIKLSSQSINGSLYSLHKCLLNESVAHV